MTDAEDKCPFCGAAYFDGSERDGIIWYECRTMISKNQTVRTEKCKDRQIARLEAELEDRTKQRDTQHYRAEVADARIEELEKELEQAREAGRIMLEVFPLMGGEPGPDMHAQVAARQKMKDALTAPKPQGGTEEVKE